MGLGSGLIFNGNGSSGGAAIIYEWLYFHLNIPISQSMLVIDLAVVFASLLISPMDNVLFAILSLYVTTLVVKWCQIGRETAVILLIESEEVDDLYTEMQSWKDIEVKKIALDEEPIIYAVTSHRHYRLVNKKIQNSEVVRSITIVSANKENQ